MTTQQPPKIHVGEAKNGSLFFYKLEDFTPIARVPASMRPYAAEMIKASNLHDELVEALKALMHENEYNELNAKWDTRRVPSSGACDKARAILAKIQS